VLDKIWKTGLPDREEMLETIMTLRQEKNIHEEQIRLLKTNTARLKK